MKKEEKKDPYKENDQDTIGERRISIPMPEIAKEDKSWYMSKMGCFRIVEHPLCQGTALLFITLTLFTVLYWLECVLMLKLFFPPTPVTPEDDYHCYGRGEHFCIGQRDQRLYRLFPSFFALFLLLLRLSHTFFMTEALFPRLADFADDADLYENEAKLNTKFFNRFIKVLHRFKISNLTTPGRKLLLRFLLTPILILINLLLPLTLFLQDWFRVYGLFSLFSILRSNESFYFFTFSIYFVVVKALHPHLDLPPHSLTLSKSLSITIIVFYVLSYVMIAYVAAFIARRTPLVTCQSKNYKVASFGSIRNTVHCLVLGSLSPSLVEYIGSVNGLIVVLIPLDLLTRDSCHKLVKAIEMNKNILEVNFIWRGCGTFRMSHYVPSHRVLSTLKMAAEIPHIQKINSVDFRSLRNGTVTTITGYKGDLLMTRLILHFLETLNNVKKVELTDCNIDDEAISLLAVSLKKNKSVQVLNLSNNKITDEGVNVLVETLMDHRNIHTLDLSYNFVRKKGAAAISRLISSYRCGIRKIFLMGNDIGPKGFDLIQKALKSNSNIISIEVQWGGGRELEEVVK